MINCAERQNKIMTMKLCKFSQRNEEEIHKIFTNRQNKIYAKKFASTQFNKRIVFVPHCMRNINACIAIEKDGYYICVECGKCKIGDISGLMRELHYSALYIAKGGRSVEKIIKDQKPEAVVGIACFFEGDQAFRTLKEKRIVMQFVPLTKDGCTATDINLKEAVKVLRCTI
ncbi:MAG: DUF116 domain-containing protein [Endomicrobium sp.]|jgi:hypothetical protein|nr:DUF116 domain-containing protein [Endomicrobium sp.]